MSDYSFESLYATLEDEVQKVLMYTKQANVHEMSVNTTKYALANLQKELSELQNEIEKAHSDWENATKLVDKISEKYAAAFRSLIKNSADLWAAPQKIEAERAQVNLLNNSLTDTSLNCATHAARRMQLQWKIQDVLRTISKMKAAESHFRALYTDTIKEMQKYETNCLLLVDAIKQKRKEELSYNKRTKR